MPSQPAFDGSTYSLIIPLYNEEDNVPLLIETVFREIGDQPQFLELVLVDDGSQDRTVEKIRLCSIDEPRIRLIQHTRNRGLGAGIRTGLQHATGDLVLYTDADLPFDFSLIPQIVAQAGSDHLVIGCRLNRDEGIRRWVLTKVYNLLIYICFGLHAKDVNFACKVIPRKLIQKIKLQSEGSFIDAEILLEALRYGFSLSEYPVIYHHRKLGQSTLSRPGVVVGIVGEMSRYMVNQLSLSMDENRLLPQSPLFRYGITSFVTALAVMLSQLLPSSLMSFSPMFLANVFLVSKYGGWKSGLMTVVLSMLAIDVFMGPPISSLTVDYADLPRAILLLTTVVIAVSIGQLRKRLTEEWSKE